MQLSQNSKAYGFNLWVAVGPNKNTFYQKQSTAGKTVDGFLFQGCLEKQDDSIFEFLAYQYQSAIRRS